MLDLFKVNVPIITKSTKEIIAQCFLLKKNKAIVKLIGKNNLNPKLKTFIFTERATLCRINFIA